MNKNDRNLIKQMITAGKFNYDIYELLVSYNAQRSKEMVKAMGDKWVCHPNNRVKRLEVPIDLLNAHRGSRILKHI